MKRNDLLGIGLLPCLMGNAMNAIATTAVTDLKSAFAEGNVKGELRSYHNYRDFKTKEDTSAFATGINLHAETALWNGFSVAGSFYVSDDLGTRSSNPAKDNPNLPTDVNILGQAYLQYQTGASLFRIGRQAVTTPFANPGDAFMIPITYEAVSFAHKTDFGLTINTLYLDRIKGRPDGDFAGTSEFSGARYQATDAPERGVWVAGIDYTQASTTLQGWHYLLPEQFHLSYLQADHGFAEAAGIKPRLALQLVHESDTGDAVLGAVDTMAAGVRLSASKGPATLYAAWNHVKSDNDAFNGGGILAPFNYSTSPVFTNSMVQTLENSSAGNAYKVGLETSIGSSVSVTLSHASYQRDGAVDTDETDADITYRFAGNLEGLSLRLRIGVIGADQSAARMTEVRSQVQYRF